MRTINIEKKLHFKEKKLNLSELELFFNNLTPNDILLAACPCRTFTEYSGLRECAGKNPVGACVYTGSTARHLISRGIGMNVSGANVVRYFKYMLSTGLESKCDTELSDDSVICLCCGCCCSHHKHSLLDGKDKITDGLGIPQVAVSCGICGVCAENCVSEAIEIDAEHKKIIIDTNRCIGCGICAFLCPEGSITGTGK